MPLEVVASAFAALGEPSRLAVWHLLLSYGDVGAPLDVIAEQVQIRPSAIVSNLRFMVDAGMLLERHFGRSRGFAVNSRSAAGIAALVDHWIEDRGEETKSVRKSAEVVNLETWLNKPASGAPDLLAASETPCAIDPDSAEMA